MNQVDPEFNWVDALGKCSSAEVFRTLRRLAKRDVETRNAQLGRDAFGFRDDYEHDPNLFSVWSKDTSHTRRAVDFHLNGPDITITGGKMKLTILLTLDNNGACKCRIGSEELDPWQVLKRALEPLLF